MVANWVVSCHFRCIFLRTAEEGSLSTWILNPWLRPWRSCRLLALTCASSAVVSNWGVNQAPCNNITNTEVRRVRMRVSNIRAPVFNPRFHLCFFIPTSYSWRCWEETTLIKLVGYLSHLGKIWVEFMTLVFGFPQLLQAFRKWSTWISSLVKYLSASWTGKQLLNLIN